MIQNEVRTRKPGDPAPGGLGLRRLRPFPPRLLRLPLRGPLRWLKESALNPGADETPTFGKLKATLAETLKPCNSISLYPSGERGPSNPLGVVHLVQSLSNSTLKPTWS